MCGIVLFLSSVVFFMTVSVYAEMEPGLDPPSIYKQCFGRMKKRAGGDTSKIPAVDIQAACDNMFMWHNAKNTILHRKSSDKTLGYIGSLIGKATQDIVHHRRKRQAGFMGPVRDIPVRKEIRMMTDHERDLFFRAVNSAKQNTSSLFTWNKYDDIANFHTGITAVSAHGGCAFHPWHRMYSYIMEQALREEGPEFAEVTIPYWYNQLETRMVNSGDPEASNMAATRSALFSERLMGSCEGTARGGIMREGWNSSIGEVIRSCGHDGPLMTDAMVYNVTRQSKMADICGEDSEIWNDLENAHNGAHRWVAGNMALLSTSVYDPIFWLHHVYIDYIWEVFRGNSKRMNRNDPNFDIATDYPLNPTIMGAHELQLPDAPMGFPISGHQNVTNIDGLSEVFTERFFRYAPPPTCSVQKPDCGSKFIKCVIDRPRGANQDRALCVARTLEEVIEWEEEQRRPKPDPCPNPLPPIPPNPQPPITPIDPQPLPPIPPMKPPHQTPRPPPTEIKAFQNTFCMNGKSDSSQWVFFPFKIIVQRPPEYKDYGSYPVDRGRINKMRGDIYAPSAYSNVNRHLRHSSHRPAVYEDCQAPNEPTNEIYVQSVGLNYEGVYKEYAIVDRRLPMTVATGYAAVRKPMSDIDESIAILHAQDRCGRVCKPVCKVPGSNVFSPCSGAVRLTGKHPLMFGNSFGDAVLDVWDFNSEKSCPQLTTQNIMISFYCDYKSDWIWPSEEPPPTPAHLVRTPPPAEPTPKQAPGCIVGYRCAVNMPCSALTPCEEGKIYECHSACHGYGVCASGKFFMTYCTRGQTFDPRTQKCAPGYCNMRTSGVASPVTRKLLKRKRRLGIMGR